MAADVCGAIGITTEQTRRLDDDERGLHSTQTPSGMQDTGLTTDSRRVAKHFGEAHKNVLRAIAQLDCSPEFRRLNFELCFEINDLANGKRDKEIHMTKDGFMFVAISFTGKEAAAIKDGLHHCLQCHGRRRASARP